MAGDPTKKADVSTMAPSLAALEDKRALVRDLYAGTQAMIDAGPKWLPQHPAESPANYKVRLEQNILTNFVWQAVDKSTSKIFAKPIILDESVPTDIQAICTNIDLQGQGLDAFILDRARQAFVDGISYILADTPKADGVQTRADEKAVGLRPYVVPINADCLIEVLAEMINGVETITRVRLMEGIQEPDGEWGYIEEDRIRVLKRDPATSAVSYELWKQDEKKENWILFEEGPTGLKRIPLVPIYTNRCGFMQGEPPFQNTAELNLEHWRSKSEQLHALSFGRFAMLSASGVSEDWSPDVGPSKVMRSTDPNAKFDYIESNGSGLDQGWKHLQAVEDSIDTAQAHLKIQNAGRITATAAAIDSAETNAGLMAVANGIEDSIETLFSYFGEMMGLGDGLVAEVGIEFDAGVPKGSDIGLQELGKAATAHIISGPALLREYMRRGELAEDFDVEKNQEELNAEPQMTPPTAEQIAAAAAAKASKSTASKAIKDDTGAQ